MKLYRDNNSLPLLLGGLWPYARLHTAFCSYVEEIRLGSLVMQQKVSHIRGLTV